MELGWVALWLVVVLALGAGALPLATWLFPDRDQAPFAVALALAVVGVVAHLVGQVAFGIPAALAGVVVLLGLSALAGRRVDPDWRRAGEAAVVFVAAVLLIVALRSVDPSAAPLPLAIGEKFLDFGLLASLERSTTLPPEDMWFAGESVRYYYGGHMLASVLGTLAGTPPALTYNLALATFYGALVTAAYGLAGAIARPYRISRRVAAGLGAFFVGIAGNLETAGRVLLWLLPDGVAAWVGSTLGLGADEINWAPADFWYFDASRVIPVDPAAEETYRAATEFPLFGWLNGDMHAHMMSQPLMVLAAGLLLAYWRTPAEKRLRRATILLGALPPVAGLLALTNVWSFPTVGGLALVVALFAPGDPAALLPDRGTAGTLRDRLRPREWWASEELRRVALAAILAVAVLLLGVIWTLPYWTGVIPGGPGKSVGLWEPWTPLGGLLLVLGAFLAAFAAYLGRRAGTVLDPAAVWVGGLATVAAFTLLGMPAVGLTLPLLLGAWWLLRTRSDTGFELALVFAGAGIVLLVELVTVEGERFNVIFKAYNHVWLFWSIAAGVVLARLSGGWPADVLDLDRPRWRTTGTVLVAVLVVSTGLYAALALPSHFDTGSVTADAEGPTLDATAYIDVYYETEAPAIRWLADRDGQPHIVTAVPAGYRWQPADGKGAAAPASLTGLPSVLGWFHEQQYRGTAPYERREGAVKSIYTGTNDSHRRALLEKYDVAYVYVGPAEQARYGEITVGELEGVTVARAWSDVTIYAVDQSRL